MDAKATSAIKRINESRELLVKISDAIWGFAELALHETKSAELLVTVLREAGFSVTTGLSDMPTAFVATWGSGKPVVGFLGEYDALAGLSQKAIPTKEELLPGKPGHGCGHNLLGVGALGAVLGLKKQMEDGGTLGTIKYFGCPAEENLSGKAFMARDGVFDDCDVCLTWHPGYANIVSGASSLANTAANFVFRGRTAHAAGDPYNGRSALDAVQLMNLGVEFLREHMPPQARVHYVIKNGGLQPNVVPAEASVWYVIRAPKVDQMKDLWERVLNCAHGAAQMTDTKVEIQLLKAIYNILNNEPLEKLIQDCMKRVGPPVFAEADHLFAAEISRTISPKVKQMLLARPILPPEEMAMLKSQILNDTVLTGPLKDMEPMGSTDVGDVSWVCPTAEFQIACQALGTPGHSWQTVAQSGMGIGHAGMLCAAKVMAEAGYELLTNPAAVEEARAFFKEASGGRKYESVMPPGQKPAFHQFSVE